ncbi:hypothetical protein BHE74_00016333 [Ensete ventricosum]|nr:hypothetical protein BHE74_00016333 [Ensete ventricosum]
MIPSVQFSDHTMIHIFVTVRCYHKPIETIYGTHIVSCSYPPPKWGKRGFAVSLRLALTMVAMLSGDIPPNQTIYINNLNEKVKKEGKKLKRSLYALFSQYGRILDVVTLKTPKLRGQAWVVFAEVPAASNAVRQMQRFPFYDKPMRIQYAKTKSDCVAKADGTYVPREKKKKQEEKGMHILFSSFLKMIYFAFLALAAEKKRRYEEAQQSASASNAQTNGGLSKNTIFSSSEAMRRKGGNVFSSIAASSEGGQRWIVIVEGELCWISRFTLFFSLFFLLPCCIPGRSQADTALRRVATVEIDHYRSVSDKVIVKNLSCLQGSQASRQGKTSSQEPTAAPNNILFIQNLPHETTTMMLQILFQQYPGFGEVRMIEAKPGIAFVEFADDVQASIAMQALQGFKITPQNPMVITYAKK